MNTTPGRPVALVTGVGRTVGIGAGIARQLAASGWDIASTYWTGYDQRMTWGSSPGRPRPSRQTWPGPGQLGITANVINPGPVDTGWMSDEIRASGIRQTPLGRLGTPQDTANLVDFLCSPRGGWINGQLLMSNGGYS